MKISPNPPRAWPRGSPQLAHGGSSPMQLGWSRSQEPTWGRVPSLGAARERDGLRPSCQPPDPPS